MLIRLITVAAIVFAALPAAPEDPPATLENIARGMPYTMNPAPHYEHCTDPGDATQLTDGVLTEGHFWTQASTVGWQGASPAYVVIDLGSVKPIRGASFRTAAGVAGVTWPGSLDVYVADEEKAFHSVGDLVELGRVHGAPPAEGYGVHRYWTDALKTHGRYIAIRIWNGPFSFADEIEVYAGEAAWLDLPFTDPAVEDLKTYTVQNIVRNAVAGRILADVDALNAKIAASGLAADVKDGMSASLGEATTACSDRAGLVIPERMILPLNALHEQVFRVQARYWTAKGYAPVTVWTSPLWEACDPLAEPQRETPAAVGVHLMRNEFRAGAFNISNAKPDAESCMITIQGLPGGENPPYITVNPVAWTDTKNLKPVAAALIEAARHGTAYAVDIPSGMTRQVWLTFHPVDIEPGEYTGTIQIATASETLSIPLAMSVYPWRFPDQPRLHCGGWDYTNRLMYGVTLDNRDALVKHLREHFVDSPWASPSTMTEGRYDADGHMTEPPDTANFDEWLERWPGARQYCVFAAVGDRIGTCAMGTPAFDAAVGAWARFWADHARGKGVNPEQLAVLLVDEPRERKQDETILAWIRAIHAANTGIRPWEDPIWGDMASALPEMYAECDVLCPNRPLFFHAKQEYRDFFINRREHGSTLDFYSCDGPARLLDPYSYYRLQAWTCWQYGAKGSYFWAFGDTGGASSWNEYLLPASSYCPVFLDATSVTPGKHLEAVREGIEDYEYLAMLQDAVTMAEKNGTTAAGAVDEARTLLATEPQRVCEGQKPITFTWHAERNRQEADTVRLAVLRLLGALHYAP